MNAHGRLKVTAIPENESTHRLSRENVCLLIPKVQHRADPKSSTQGYRYNWVAFIILEVRLLT